MLHFLHSDDLGKLVLRLVLGALLLLHGLAKIIHPGSLDFIGTQLTGIGLPTVLAYGVYIGEVVAPLMILLGIYARLGGMLGIVNMLFAIVLAHSGDLFSLTQHGGWALELQGFYLFGSLAIVFLGSGRLAVRPD